MTVGSDSWLGTIPTHWQVRRLGTLGSFTKGMGGSKEDNQDEGVPVVRYGELYTRFDRVIEQAHTFVAEEAAVRYTPLRHGTIVFAGSGEDPEEIGRSALSLLDEPAYVGGDTVLFSPRSSTSHAPYLTYALESRPLKALKAIRSTGFTVVHISAGKLKTLPIPLPPLDEQREIADYLDHETAQIDELIAEQQRLVELLHERRSALITAAVTGQIDGGGGASGFPEGWRRGNIRRFAAMKTGHTPSRSVPEYWEGTSIPWFTLADVWQLRDGQQVYLGETANQISELGLANSAAELLPTGTVVLSRTASVGFSGVMPEPMATSQDFWNWVCGPDIVPEYLNYQFKAIAPDLRALNMGSTHQTIYRKDAAGIEVLVPPVREQRAITGYLDRQTSRIDTLISEAERFIELSRERRSALITAAVTGQIDVRSIA